MIEKGKMENIYEQTNLWKKSLATQKGNDADSRAREKLRNAFWAFREKAAILVGEIHKDLPEYTVHDISHLDSLWEMADLIVGENFSLTPTEAFVLGGAILLHDAGMSLAAYPRGLDALRETETWKDIIIKQYKSKHNRLPTQEEIVNPSEEIKHNTIGLLLRNLHASQAERLASTEWRSESSSSPQYLIEDNQIRQSFGKLIGQIAHSHWWSIAQVETNFSRVIGASPWCPDTWVVNPLKIACILRVADASHIDARRAPSFLRAIRKLPASSDIHWKFQEKLQKPYLSDDALAYTSGYAFPLQDAESWWLCLETLKIIDGELRQVDALLAERAHQRFTAKRVAGINNPERFASFVPTDGWHPISASIQVSDIPTLIKSLGGEELYGDDKAIALRELIQNACDAIRARRILENRPNDWGTVCIRLGKDERGDWLEVEDNGIGMSLQVLAQYLLDFGKSYWGSDLMIEEFPGLLATGIQTTGKYGIGFFSIFMLGSAVRIYTRRYYSGQSDTMTLEFNTGVSSKPIFRPAEKSEQIREGGTRIRVWLDKSLEETILKRPNRKEPLTLSNIIEEICLNVDVNIELQENLRPPVCVVSSNEWVELKGINFFRRISNWDSNNPPDYEKEDFENFINQAEKNLRVLKDENGEVIGRVCVAPHNRGSFKYISLGGAVTIGGLYASPLNGIAGILTGKVINTARDESIPHVSQKAISTWASEQAKLVPLLYKEPKLLMECAQIISILGGDTGELPIGHYQEEWVSYYDIASNKSLPNKIYLIWDYYLKDFTQIEGFKPLPNIISGDYAGYPIILSGKNRFPRFNDWPNIIKYESLSEKSNIFLKQLPGIVLEAIFKAWDIQITNLPEDFIEKVENREKEVIIGYIGDAPVKSNVFVITKPDNQ